MRGHRIGLLLLAWVLWHDSSVYMRQPENFASSDSSIWQARAPFETRAECDKALKEYAVDPGKYLSSLTRSMLSGEPVPVDGGALFRRQNGGFMASRFECWPAGAYPYELRLKR